MRLKELSLLAFGASALLGCTALLGGGQDEPSGSGSGSAEGDGDGDDASGVPGEGIATQLPGGETLEGCVGEAGIGVAPLRRLSSTQYQNTIVDLVSAAGGDALLGTLDSYFSRLPSDGDGSDFRRMDNRLSQTHIDVQLDVAFHLAEELSADPDALAGECATQSPLSASCLEGFVHDWGERALRRPLTDEDAAHYTSLFDESADASENFRRSLALLFSSPRLFYQFEIDGTEVPEDTDVLLLDSYELASRLSYHFIQSPPDDELLALAASGDLLDDAVYAAQIERLAAHESTKTTIDGFYGDWLGLEELPGFLDTEAFATFAEGTPALDRGEALVDGMKEEVYALTSRVTWDVPGSVGDLFSTADNVVTSPELAELYGVTPWDGVSPPQALPNRAGLLTRAAMLMSGNEESGPIHRGVFIRRRILCDDLPAPDPDALPEGALELPPNDGTQSTRDVVAMKTADPQCQNCHSAFNGFGFALEAYDGLGRFRDIESVIGEDGEVLGQVPVDTIVSMSINGEEVALDGPLDLSEELANVDASSECFAEFYFTFAHRRESESADACSIDSLGNLLADGGTLRDAISTVALQPAFRARRIR